MRKGIDIMSLTHAETIVSLPLDTTADEELCGGWQEIRACTFVDFGSNSRKPSRHRLKVAIVVMLDPGKSYGEVSIWASSSWKSILKVNLYDLPSTEGIAGSEGEEYGEAIEWLFHAGCKVVG